jgi:hypothetical protein
VSPRRYIATSSPNFFVISIVLQGCLRPRLPGHRRHLCSGLHPKHLEAAHRNPA